MDLETEGEALKRKVEELDSSVNRLAELVERSAPKSKRKHDEYKQDFSCDENEARGNWSCRLDFPLACLGYCDGMGTIVRFPHLMFKNGGAAFLIPYVIMLVCIGIPLYLLEVSLGQYTSSGTWACWNMARLFQGVGLGMVVINALFTIYAGMINAWMFYYLFASFTSDLPWQYCDREWNTPFCLNQLPNVTYDSCLALDLRPAMDGVCYDGFSGRNSTPYGIWDTGLAEVHGIKLPSEEYFNTEVLGSTDALDGLSNMGPIRWQLALCLLLSWVIVCLTHIKGIKSYGKVVYVTVLCSYVLFIILLVRGVVLDGSKQGIEAYLEVNMTKLEDPVVWKDAGIRVLFSLGASFGGLITLSSYNRFHYDCVSVSIVIPIVNLVVGFVAGIMVFSFLGYMANDFGLDVKNLAATDQGLAFVVFPMAITSIPLPTLWAIFFFLMLAMLGLSTQFGTVATVTTAIMDQWPRTRRYKWAVILGFSAAMFLLGLTQCTNAGSHMFLLMVSYLDERANLFLGFFECICIAFVYGFLRYRIDIRTMLGHTGSMGAACWAGCFPWWIIGWVLLAPLGILYTLVLSWVVYEDPTYGDYVYKSWEHALGWLMFAAVMAPVIIVPIVLIFLTPGSFVQRLGQLSSPNVLWGPALPKHRRLNKHLPHFLFDPWDRRASTESVVTVTEGHDVANESGEATV